MTPEEEALARVIRSLEDAGIPYMVTGSLASSHHGRPRMTNDADVVIDPDLPALQRLVEELVQAGFAADLARALDSFRRRRQFNVIDPLTASKIDLIFRKDRPFSHEELRRARHAQLGSGTLARLASPEDTILSKLEWALKAGGSDRQLADAAGILAVQGEALDRAYVERWAAELEVADLWQRLLSGS